MNSFAFCTLVAAAVALPVVLTAAPGTIYDTPESFLSAVSSGAISRDYSVDKLALAIENFNRAQDKRFQVLDDGADPSEPGHAFATVEDLGDYFAVKIQTVESAHTDGIDGGEDSHLSAFFRKSPIRPLIELDGPTYPFKDSRLQLSLPALETCMGTTPKGVLSVYDIVTGKQLVTRELPEGTLFTTVAALRNGTHEIRVIAESEEPALSDSERHCEVGSWVRKTKTLLTVRCDLSASSCRIRTVPVMSRQGCSSIGGCD